MAFLLSPGVQVRETDLTNIIPAVATSIGGFVGPFAWGPTDEITTVSSESDLISKFGRPTASYNVREWYSAANFLGYTNNLKVIRTTGTNAGAGVGTAASHALSAKYDGAMGNSLGVAVIGSSYSPSTIVGGSDINYVVDFTSNDFAEVVAGNDSDTATTGPDTLAIGDTPTTFTVLGVDFEVATATTIDATSAQDVANAFAIAVNTLLTGNAVSSDPAGVVIPVSATTTTGQIRIPLSNLNASSSDSSAVAEFKSLVKSSIFTSEISTFAIRTDILATADHNAEGLTENGTLDTGFSAVSDTSFLYGTAGEFTTYDNALTAAPLGDEVSVIVYDFDGGFTGEAGSILETYEFINQDQPGTKTLDGAPNYILDIIGSNGTSNYITTSAWVAGVSTGFIKLSSGTNGDALTSGDSITAWNLFADAEAVDVNILFAGDVNTTVKSHIIDNVANVRKDCIAVVAPDEISSTSAADIVAYFQNYNSTSYGVFVSGWKRQYDRYNDAYITMPTDSDVAGLMARTDRTNDAWWSPAGLNRGQINNVVSLTFNPTATDRDTLYKNRINPIVTLPGQGTVLFGDKTSLSRPSAFDRINVRRLFIVLEKAIATAAKFQLFEFNDEFTRANFVAAVEPFLRDIRARRGLTDFFIKSDAENNTSAVIDRNEFVADIYIKPARSINFIRLNFVAVRSGVNFSEVVGR